MFGQVSFTSETLLGVTLPEELIRAFEACSLLACLFAFQPGKFIMCQKWTHNRSPKASVPLMDKGKLADLPVFFEVLWGTQNFLKKHQIKMTGFSAEKHGL